MLEHLSLWTFIRSLWIHERLVQTVCGFCTAQIEVQENTDDNDKGHGDENADDAIIQTALKPERNR